jgi:hypothetical protein
LGFEHQVARGGLGGSPHATGWCPGLAFPPGDPGDETPGAAPRASDPIREGRRGPRYDGPWEPAPGLGPAAEDLLRRVDGRVRAW